MHESDDMKNVINERSNLSSPPSRSLEEKRRKYYVHTKQNYFHDGTLFPPPFCISGGAFNTNRIIPTTAQKLNKTVENIFKRIIFVAVDSCQMNPNLTVVLLKQRN